MLFPVMKTKTAVTLVAVNAVMGGSLVVGVANIAPAIEDVAVAAPCSADAYAREMGDDNCDGVIVEDESGWNCATMGNFICG